MALLILIVAIAATLIAGSMIKRRTSWLIAYSAGLAGAVMFGVVARELVQSSAVMLIHPFSALLGASLFILAANRFAGTKA